MKHDSPRICAIIRSISVAAVAPNRISVHHDAMVPPIHQQPIVHVVCVCVSVSNRPYHTQSMRMYQCKQINAQQQQKNYLYRMYSCECMLLIFGVFSLFFCCCSVCRMSAPNKNDEWINNRKKNQSPKSDLLVGGVLCIEREKWMLLWKFRKMMVFARILNGDCSKGDKIRISFPSVCINFFQCSLVRSLALRVVLLFFV